MKRLFSPIGFLVVSFFLSSNVWAATVTPWTEVTAGGTPDNEYSFSSPSHSRLETQEIGDGFTGNEKSEAKAFADGINSISVGAYHWVVLGESGGGGGPSEWDGKAHAKIQWNEAYVVTPASHIWSFEIPRAQLCISGGVNQGENGQLFGSGHGYQKAGYRIDISVNGISAWGSAADLVGNWSGQGFSSSFLNNTYDQLGLTVTENDSGNKCFAAADKQQFSIDLMQYAVNGYAAVQYVMEAWATDIPGGTHLGDEFFTLGGEASVGDPFDLDGGVLIHDEGLLKGSPVPAPASLFLLMGGLAGIFGLKKRKKASA